MDGPMPVPDHPQPEWSRVAASCASVLMPGGLRAVEDAVGPSVAGLDVWLWDHQRRLLCSLRSGATTASLADEPRVGHIHALDHHGDLIGHVTADESGSGSTAEVLAALAPMVSAAVRASEATLDTVNIARRSREMSLPAEMQWALLPPTGFRAGAAHISAAVEPAYDTGGDVFDYAFHEGRLFVALIDAMGHGLRAALTATLAVGAMRRARRNGSGLESIAAEIDAALNSPDFEDDFASGVLMDIDVRSGRGEWLSAGHLPPLLVRDDELTALPVVPALPFGMSIGGAHSRPRARSIVLEPGDVLVLYSDGIIDNAALDDDRPVGVDRFHLALRHQLAGPGHGPARRVVDELLDATGPSLRDDATLLVLEIGDHDRTPSLPSDGGG